MSTIPEPLNPLTPEEFEDVAGNVYTRVALKKIAPPTEMPPFLFDNPVYQKASGLSYGEWRERWAEYRRKTDPRHRALRFQKETEGYTTEQISSATEELHPLDAFALKLQHFGDVDAALTSTFGKSLDKEAKIKFYAEYLHWDREYVRANFEDTEKHYIFADMQHVMADKDSEIARKWLAHEDNMVIARDSYIPLAKLNAILVSRHSGYFGHSAYKAAQVFTQFERAGAATNQALYEALGFGGEAVAMKAERHYLQNINPPLSKKLNEGVYGFFTQFPATLANLGIYAAATAVSPGVGAATMFGQAFGTGYGTARDRGTNQAMSLLTAIPLGVGETWLEQKQLKAIGKVVGVGGKTIGKQFIRDYAQGALDNFYQEFLQSLNQEVWSIVGDIGTSRFKDIAQRMIDAGKEGGYSGAQAAMAVAAIGSPRAMATATEVTNNRHMLNQIAKALKIIKDEKLTKRSPEAMADAVGKMTEDTGLHTIGLDAEILDEIVFQTAQDGKEGETVSGMTKKEVLTELGLAEADYRAALETGGQVTFSFARFATRLGKTRVGESLIPHLRPENGMTIAEEAEIRAKYVDLTVELTNDLADLVAKPEIDPERFKAIRASLRQKGGFAPEHADYIMLMVRKMHEKYAREAKVSLEEATTKIGLEFRFDQDAVSLVTSRGAETEGKHGATVFQDGATIVAVFQKADKVNVLHELGEIFTKNMITLSEAEGASSQLKADVAALVRTAGGKLDLAGRDKIARMFEAYLWEGRAPHPEMTGAFRMFTKWMMDTYSAVKSLLGPDSLNDEIREVFDRWLATKHEVEQAEAKYRTLEEPGDFLPDDPKAQRVKEEGQRKDVGLEETQEEEVDEDAEDTEDTEDTKSAGRQATEEMREAVPEDIVKIREEARERAQRAQDKALVAHAKKRIGVMLNKLQGGAKGLRAWAKEQAEKEKIFVALQDMAEAGHIHPENLVNILPEADIEAVIKDLSRHGPLFSAPLRGKGKRRTPGLTEVKLEEIAKKNGFKSAQELLEALQESVTLGERTNKMIEQIREDMLAEEINNLQEIGWQPGDAATHTDAHLEFLIVSLEIAKGNWDKAKSARSRRIEIAARKESALRFLTDHLIARDIAHLKHWVRKEAKYALEAVKAAKKGDTLAMAEALEQRLKYFVIINQAIGLRDEILKIQRYFAVKQMKTWLKEVSYAYRPVIINLFKYYRLNPNDKEAREIPPAAPGEILETPVAFADIKAHPGIENHMPDFDRATPNFIKNLERPDQKEGVKYRGILDLKYEQIQELKNFMDWLVDQGKGTLNAMNAEGYMTLGDLKKDSMSRMETLPDAVMGDYGTAAELALWVLEEGESFVVQPEFILDEADGNPLLRGKEMGPMQKLFNQLHKASVASIEREQLLLEGNGRDIPGLRQAYNTLGKDKTRVEGRFGADRNFDVKGVPIQGHPTREAAFDRMNIKKWNYDTIVMVLLNWGNAGNIHAMRQSVYGITDAEMRQLAMVLSPEALNAINQIWTTIDSLQSDMAKITLEMENRVMGKVEAIAFSLETTDTIGTQVTVPMRGGYFPLVFDPRLDKKAKDHQEKESTISLITSETNLRRQTKLNKSATLDRLVDKDGNPVVTRPPWLDPDVTLRHVQRVIRHVTHGKVLPDAWKMFNDPDWEKLFVKKLGVAKHRVLRNLVADMANPHSPHDTNWATKALTWMRNKYTVGKLGLNIFTGFKQRLSMINAINALAETLVEPGGKSKPGSTRFLAAKYFLRGVNAMGWSSQLAGPKTAAKTGMKRIQNMIDTINSLSGDMRTRSAAGDADVRQVVQQLKKGFGAFKLNIAGKEIDAKTFKDSVFWWIRANDAAAVYPIWYGAYVMAKEQHLNGIKRSMSNEEATKRAAEYADRIIRVSQPASLLPDLSQAQKTKSAIRFVNLFMTWKLKHGNRMIQHIRGKAKGRISNAEFSKYFATEVLVPALVRISMYSSMAAAYYDEDDKPDFLKEYLINTGTDMVSWMPLVSNTVDAFQHVRSAGKFPAFEGIVKTTNAFRQFDSDAPGETAFRFWQSLEWWMGLPLSKPLMQIKRELDLIEGK